MNVLLAAVLLSLAPLFVDACGQRPPGLRIIGGAEATPNSWPWQLSLRHLGNPSCGASLISPQWAVTAAHCVSWDWHRPTRYSVVAGAHDKITDGEQYPVTKVIIHEHYSPWNYRNDIALLRLAVPVALGPKVSTVCLPPKGSRVPPGKSCWVSGWGRFSQSSSHGSRVLKEANLPIVGQSECARKNGDKVHEQTMVCVGGGTGTTVCHGDSGGPLVCEEGPGQWVLRGVASWVSDKSCPKDGYSVYVRVGSYLDWIKKQITGAGNGGTSGGVCQDIAGTSNCQNYLPYCYADNVIKHCQKSCRFCL